jgi:hypothetical protein
MMQIIHRRGKYGNGRNWEGSGGLNGIERGVAPLIPILLSEVGKLTERWEV